MAELATIARPYADALFKAVSAQDAAAVADQVGSLAQVAGNEQVRQFADNPKVTAGQVFDLITSVSQGFLGDAAKNLLRMVIENGRLAALPEIAAQFHALVNARSGVSDATIHSAFPIDAAQLPEVVASLEKRFGRKLNRERGGRARADRRHPRGGRRRGARHLRQGQTRTNEGRVDRVAPRRGARVSPTSRRKT